MGKNRKNAKVAKEVQRHLQEQQQLAIPINHIPTMSPQPGMAPGGPMPGFSPSAIINSCTELLQAGTYSVMTASYAQIHLQQAELLKRKKRSPSSSSSSSSNDPKQALEDSKQPLEDSGSQPSGSQHIPEPTKKVIEGYAVGTHPKAPGPKPAEAIPLLAGPPAAVAGQEM